MLVVSTALQGLYCRLTHSPIRSSVNIDAQNLPSRRRAWKYLAWVWLAGCAVLACQHETASAQGAAAAPQDRIIETGAASYYGRAHHGRRTASGRRFDQKALTAAHSWLPFGTMVRVTLAGTNRSVVVEITDRLYSARRVLDLSLAAARALGMVRQGVASVSLTPG